MKSYKMRRIIVFLALSFLLLTACQLGVPETRNQPVEPTGTAVPPLETVIDAPAPEATKVETLATPTGDSSVLPQTVYMVPKGWQGFYNYVQGYSLAYPTLWALSEETKFSRVFDEIMEEPAGMGPPLRLYVSVIPEEYTNQVEGAYLFTGESIREFMALPVGESNLKEPDAMPPDCFNYTRLPDRKLAGQTALVIENSQVWEAPIGTKDRVVIIVTEGTTYILGMNYETPQQLAMFEQVLDSFQFIY